MSTPTEILKASRTIAVVGLSTDPYRPSHEVAAYLQEAGYRIIPVNPNVTEVLGERAYANLRDIPDPVDIVDNIRRVAGDHERVPGDDPRCAARARGALIRHLSAQQPVDDPDLPCYIDVYQ